MWWSSSTSFFAGTPRAVVLPAAVRPCAPTTAIEPARSRPRRRSHKSLEAVVLLLCRCVSRPYAACQVQRTNRSIV